MAYSDVFATGFFFPERVCVLAPGPNGVPYYRKIPENFFVVAVSRAVLINQVRIDAWVMQGRNRIFYREGEQRFKGIRLFRREFVDRGEALATADEFERYSFEVERNPPGVIADFSPLAAPREKLIGGSTISGNALQLAYLRGAREILLCGVDMSGDRYFDGSCNVDPTHGEIWSFAPALNRLIDWVVGNTETKVWSLSPTKLAVSRYPV